MTGAPSESGRAAFVAFTGRTDLAWLRLLRPGFRHCLVGVRVGPGRGEEEEGGGWLVCDPLSHRTDLHLAVAAGGLDLPGRLRRHGHTVIEGVVGEPPHRSAPWRPYTCVEAVKRVLGVHAPAVLTPWQLHRHLTTRCGFRDREIIPQKLVDSPI